MTRSALDKLISAAGIIIVLVLAVASIALFWTYNFVHGQVHDQLASEKIYFPAADTAGLTSLPASDQSLVAKYAGQQLLTGAQAEVFADHYIAVHLSKIGGGKTYSQLSSESLADPANTALAGQVQTVFRGETLRGLLLNAYAFDTAALVAYYAAIGAGIASILLLLLSLLGFRHAAKVHKTKR
jgi:hypothetical protein